MSKRYIVTTTLEIIDDKRPTFVSEQKQVCYDLTTIAQLCFGIGLILEARAKDELHHEKS